jgi:hypothetical protein
MNDVMNDFDQLLALALTSVLAIQLYISNDKIESKFWRISANVFPVFVLVGVILFMRFGK